MTTWGGRQVWPEPCSNIDLQAPNSCAGSLGSGLLTISTLSLVNNTFFDAGIYSPLSKQLTHGACSEIVPASPGIQSVLIKWRSILSVYARGGRQAGYRVCAYFRDEMESMCLTVRISKERI